MNLVRSLLSYLCSVLALDPNKVTFFARCQYCYSCFLEFVHLRWALLRRHIMMYGWKPTEAIYQLQIQSVTKLTSLRTSETECSHPEI